MLSTWKPARGTSGWAEDTHGLRTAPLVSVHLSSRGQRAGATRKYRGCCCCSPRHRAAPSPATRSPSATLVKLNLRWPKRRGEAASRANLTAQRLETPRSSRAPFVFMGGARGALAGWCITACQQSSLSTSLWATGLWNLEKIFLVFFSWRLFQVLVLLLHYWETKMLCIILVYFTKISHCRYPVNGCISCQVRFRSYLRICGVASCPAPVDTCERNW